MKHVTRGLVEEQRELAHNGESSFEEPAVRAAPGPGFRTHEKREQQELSHFPFRPWCVGCVVVQAADDPHRRAPPPEEIRLPTVSVDYGFITSAAALK